MPRTERKGSYPNYPQESRCPSQFLVKGIAYLLLFRELFILFGKYLGEIQVAHFWVQFGIFCSLFHEEAEVRGQRFLGEIRMFLNGPCREEGHKENILL